MSSPAHSSSNSLDQVYHKYQILDLPFELPSRFTPIKPIGRGATGVVISATDEHTGQVVAIKRCADVLLGPAGVMSALRFLREIELLNFMDHPNVLSCPDLLIPSSSQDFDVVYIVTEKMDADLHIVLRTQELSADHRMYFMYQLLCAVNYLHSAGIVHRDLKPPNILINAACRLKVCDFGLSRGVAEEGQAMTEYVVTRQYRAPEIMLATRKYGPAVDMWSIGCIFAEMLLSSLPSVGDGDGAWCGPLFPGRDYLEMLQMIVRFTGTPTPSQLPVGISKRARAYLDSLPHCDGLDLPQYFEGAGAEALDLLSRLLVLNPAHRITAAEALRHPYFFRLSQEADMAPAPAAFHTAFGDDVVGSMTPDDVRQALRHLAAKTTGGAAAPASGGGSASSSEQQTTAHPPQPPQQHK